MKALVIIGTGGYAQEVLWVADDINVLQPTWSFMGFIDPLKPEQKGSLLYDRPVLGGFEDVVSGSEQVYFACGIGDPQARAKECREAESRGWIPATLVHPTAVVARHVEVGPGTIVGAGTVLGPYASVGRHCEINVQATIGHNSVIGDFSVVLPGARISGYVVLEEETMIGSNACILQGMRVGPRSRVGANSFLANHLPADRTVIGLPARPFLPVK